MRCPLVATLAFCMLTSSIHAGAETSPVESESKAMPLAENGLPIERLIATLAKKTGKKSWSIRACTRISS